MNQDQQHLLNEQLTSTLVKLERDIERHRGERQYHMRRTNIMVKIAVVFLLIMGCFNILYIWDFYVRMQVIVNTITDLGTDVAVVSTNMVHLTETMHKFDSHMNTMPAISNASQSMSEQLPVMNQSMEQMLGSFNAVNREMTVMSQDIVEINQRFGHITQGMNVMSSNVNAISGPMGMFNPFMP